MKKLILALIFFFCLSGLPYADQFGTKPFGRHPFAGNGPFGRNPFATSSGTGPPAGALQDDSGNLIKDDSGNYIIDP
jgi:hypothetical protein